MEKIQHYTVRRVPVPEISPTGETAIPQRINGLERTSVVMGTLLGASVGTGLVEHSNDVMKYTLGTLMGIVGGFLYYKIVELSKYSQ